MTCSEHNKPMAALRAACRVASSPLLDLSPDVGLSGHIGPQTVEPVQKRDTVLSMLASPEISHFTAAGPPDTDYAEQLARVARVLRESFGVAFSLWNAESGELVHASVEQPGCNDAVRGQMARALHGNSPEFLADEDCLLLLGVPFSLRHGESIVGTAAFAARPLQPGERPAAAAGLLTVDEARTSAWIADQTVWTHEALVRLARAAQARFAAELRSQQLEREVEKVSDNLASTYEEICLLHSLTQNLRLRSDDEALCRLVLGCLLDCAPAHSAAIQLLPVAKEGQITYKARTQSVLLSAGDCPLQNTQFTRLVESLQLSAFGGPRVVNRRYTAADGWPFPDVRQLVIVPMSEGDRVFGWLAIFNHANDQEFGTVEASLLNSIGSLLGIHSSNRDLYRMQSEFLASVVRAFTSAIDAKDPYTCGHSDRVARVAVRLAKELGCDAELLHTLYMAGLLHDVGKIGIDDAVLRKPEKLTEAEFEHIKEHPSLGYRILADISQLSAVLPAVLHHHEQWDGRGYPMKLVSDQIPLIARIVAVADAFDAMSSDRPYRKGMSVEKVNEIFKRGAGQQWDPEVITAYFAAYDDIVEIARHERANLTLDVEQWT
jgi:putative nucleotidyltransferase with HDIG domain